MRTKINEAEKSKFLSGLQEILSLSISPKDKAEFIQETLSNHRLTPPQDYLIVACHRTTPDSFLNCLYKAVFSEYFEKEYASPIVDFIDSLNDGAFRPSSPPAHIHKNILEVFKAIEDEIDKDKK